MEHDHRGPQNHNHDSDRSRGSGMEAGAPIAASFRAGRAYKVRGLDCAEEVAVLKRAVGARWWCGSTCLRCLEWPHDGGRQRR